MADVADSSALLSTMAGAGATLVAIIGGFLVSRYVSLDGEQQGAKRTLDEVTARLETAQGDRKLARVDRAYARAREAIDDAQVLSMLCREYIHGEEAREQRRPVPEDTSPEEVLRMVDDVSDIDEEIFADALRQARKQVGLALSKLAPVMDDHAAVVAKLNQLLGWSDIRQEYDLRIPPEFLPVWVFVWEKWLTPRARVAVRERLEREGRKAMGILYVAPVYLPDSGISEWDRLQLDGSLADPEDARREDERIKALEAERGFAAHAYGAIGKPSGLFSGLAVLALLACLQVVPPILFLAPTPATLSTCQAAALLAAFAAGLLILFGYLLRYASRLGLTKRTAPTPPPIPPPPSR